MRSVHSGSAMPTSRDTLLEELVFDGDQYFDAGRQNNLADIALSVMAVLASLVATVLVGAQVSPIITATMAALPAACASIQRIVDLRARASWYFIHAARVRALARELEHASEPDLAHFARRRGELEVSMEREWATIGRAGVKPRGGGPRSR